MIGNKQLARNLFPNNNKPPTPLQTSKQTSPNSNDLSSSAIVNALLCILNKKYTDAYTVGSKLKLGAVQQLTRIAYEYNLLQYLLHTRDKIVQINPEQHLLTETGLLNLRTMGNYREEAIQARAHYAAIADNIKKLANSTNYFQCTLPNKQELTDIKNALFMVFQDMKNKQKQVQTQPHSFATSEAIDKEKEKNITSQLKENLLEIISLLMPTQTLRSSFNREKSLQQLVKIAKDHIKQAFEGFKHELELVQSRAHFCERSLESERATKQEKEKQLQRLREELITSQRYIEDLEGLKAATEMENLGLHSKIRFAEDESQKSFFEEEIDRLRLENEQLANKIAQMGGKMEKLKEEMLEDRREMLDLQAQLQKKLQQSHSKNCQQKQHLLEQLEIERNKRQQLKQSLSIKQSSIHRLQQELALLSERQKTLLHQNSTLKLEKEHFEAETIRLQQMRVKFEDYQDEINKLQDEVQTLSSHNIHLRGCLQQEQERRAANDTLIDHLQKLLQEGEQERTRLHEEFEALACESQAYCEAATELEYRVRELQQEAAFASKNQHKFAGQEEKGVCTVVTLDDLKVIEQSLANLAERENELEELYSQNQILKNKLYENQWAEHA